MSLPSSPDFAGIHTRALAELSDAKNAPAMQAWRTRYLGRQGETQKLLDGLKSLPPAEAANDLRKALEEAWEKQAAGGGSETGAGASGVDVTLPGRPTPSGAQHVVTQTLDRITDIFYRLGFALADGPEIETEHHNFDALNTQPDHPARDEADTFYLNLPPGPHGRWLSCANSRFGKKEATYQDHRPRPLLSAGRGGCDSWDFLSSGGGTLCGGRNWAAPSQRGVGVFLSRTFGGGNQGEVTAPLLPIHRAEF